MYNYLEGGFYNNAVHVLYNIGAMHVDTSLSRSCSCSCSCSCSSQINDEVKFNNDDSLSASCSCKVDIYYLEGTK